MYKIGVDIGGTNIAVGVVDKDYKIIARYTVKTPNKCSLKEFCDTVITSIRECIKKANIKNIEIESIGLAYPGTVDSENGILYYANNLDFDEISIKKVLLEQFPNVNIEVENDANAAAFGEFIAGSLKGTRDAIAVTIGTGVGGGIIINKRIYTGFNFSAGEFGHHVIITEGKDCTCGRKGCFEAYASANALAEIAKEKLKENNKSIMLKMINNTEEINGYVIFEALKKNDKIAREVFDEYINYLAIGVANIINIFAPEKLCIGGGLSAQGDVLLKPLNKLIQKYIYEKAKPSIVTCAELGNDAGIIGSALLDLQNK